MKPFDRQLEESDSDPSFQGAEEVQERLRTYYPEIAFERVSNDPLDPYRNIVRYTSRGRQTIITHASPVLQRAFALGLLQHIPSRHQAMVAVCLRSQEEGIQDYGRQLRRQLRRMGYRVYLQRPSQKEIPPEVEVAVILRPEDLTRNEVRVLHSHGQDQVSLEELGLYLTLLAPARPRMKRERRRE